MNIRNTFNQRRMILDLSVALLIGAGVWLGLLITSAQQIRTVTSGVAMVPTTQHVLGVEQASAGGTVSGPPVPPPGPQPVGWSIGSTFLQCLQTQPVQLSYSYQIKWPSGSTPWIKSYVNGMQVFNGSWLPGQIWYQSYHPGDFVVSDLYELSGGSYLLRASTNIVVPNACPEVLPTPAPIASYPATPSATVNPWQATPSAGARSIGRETSTWQVNILSEGCLEDGGTNYWFSLEWPQGDQASVQAYINDQKVRGLSVADTPTFGLPLTGGQTGRLELYGPADGSGSGVTLRAVATVKSLAACGSIASLGSGSTSATPSAVWQSSAAAVPLSASGSALVRPSISSQKVDGLTVNRAVVHWQSDVPAKGWVEYGTTAEALTASTGVPLTGNENLEASIDGLVRHTTYYYRTVTVGASGVPTYSDIKSFTTKSITILWFSF